MVAEAGAARLRTAAAAWNPASWFLTVVPKGRLSSPGLLPLDWPNPPTYVQSDESAAEIKELLVERPVGTSMRVFDDLYNYKTGIYEPSATANKEGLHAAGLP